MDKKYNISTLLDFYGDMLTERQRTAAELYYNEDLSLSEIAEEIGISRQGVRAALVKSKEILIGFESKLGLAQRFYKAKKNVDTLLEYAEKVRAQSEKTGDERLGMIARDIIMLTSKIEKDIG